ncbi:MAG: glutathione S-transferase N-terminal domain-containing protein [Gaiellaceae bacterium]
MAVKLHRCRFVGFGSVFTSHPCSKVQRALDEAGVDYEIVKEPTYPRRRRKDVIEHTGTHFLPAIELEDGSWYREDSDAMAEAIRAGRLSEMHGNVPRPGQGSG